MKITLEMPPGMYERLLAHLLPEASTREEAAFLFAMEKRIKDDRTFEVIEATMLSPNEFEARMGDYLELSDSARARIIKRAHDLGASLVEMHSHPFPFPAAFSIVDREGLRETVRHVWWRLKGRPYLALVVAPSGFDALVWLDNPVVPRALDALLDGDRLLGPTNNSISGWE